jgi:predicted Zn-dependent peptidase
MHGTTAATNAVLEGKGARVGLVTTEGYRQILQVARSYVPGGLAGWIIWPKPEPLATVEPPQASEREVILHERAQPLYIEGYHKPSALDLKNEQIFDALQDLLSNGRTSRLYRSLVRDKKIAAFSGGFNDFPGAKYPDLFVFFAVPTPGHTPEELRDAIRAEIERLKSEDITDDELKMVKTRVKADLLRSLDSNLGLAQQFATGQALLGDWRYPFEEADRIGQVSKADIRRIAKQTFVASNRDVGIIESTEMAGSAGKEAQQ